MAVFAIFALMYFNLKFLIYFIVYIPQLNTMQSQIFSECKD